MYLYAHGKETWYVLPGTRLVLIRSCIIRSDNFPLVEWSALIAFHFVIIKTSIQLSKASFLVAL